LREDPKVDPDITDDHSPKGFLKRLKRMKSRHYDKNDMTEEEKEALKELQEQEEKMKEEKEKEKILKMQKIKEKL